MRLPYIIKKIDFILFYLSTTYAFIGKAYALGPLCLGPLSSRICHSQTTSFMSIWTNAECSWSLDTENPLTNDILDFARV